MKQPLMRAWVNSCRSVGFGTVVAISGTPSSLSALQNVENRFYYNSFQQQSAAVHLDSMAVQKNSGVESGELIDSMVAEGLSFVRDIPGGILVFGITQISASGLQARARDLEDEHPTLIRKAGSLVRIPGEDIPMVLTDRFTVRFRPGVSQSQVDSMNAEHNVVDVSPTNLIPNHFLLETTEGSAGDAIEISNTYHESVLVELAHPNYLGGISHGAVNVSDPLFYAQWHLQNNGVTQNAIPPTGGDINAVPAWSITKGSDEVILAILELSGFDTSHPDLIPNLWTHPVIGSYGWNFVYNSPDHTLGDMTHGTAVAGLAAARGENDLGVSGSCPQCKLMLLSATGAFQTAEALQYAQDNGAAVVNNSWFIRKGALPDIDAQVELAVNAGMKIVFAMRDRTHPAGNRCDSPPAVDLGVIEHVISVGASTDLDHRAQYGAWGSCLDVLAPGSTNPLGTNDSTFYGIVTTDIVGSEGYNNNPPGISAINDPKYGCDGVSVNNIVVPDFPDAAYTGCFGGTSASAPIVSGVIGLMLSLDPDLGPSDVEQILRETARQPLPITGPVDQPFNLNGFSTTHGYGRVDAYCALRRVQGLADDDCPDFEGQVDPSACQNEQPPPCLPNEGSFLEIGTRLGLTVMDGSVQRTVLNGPGSGPLSLPVLYGAWFLNHAWEIELQAGGSLEVGGGNPSTKEFVAALQPGLHFSVSSSGSWFIAPSIAGHWMTVGSGPITNNIGAGLALGRRLRPRPFLAVRFEARYRRWFSTEIDEMGFAVGVGIVLN